MKTPQRQPLGIVPVYLSSESANKASSELTNAFSLLNLTIHLYSNLNENDKEKFLDEVKTWVVEVDV